MSLTDDLTSIADILDKYSQNGDYRPLMKRICDTSHEKTPLYLDLKFALERRGRYQDIGEIALIDVATAKLKAINRGDFAHELQTTIETIKDRLKSWEEKWVWIVRKYGPEAREIAAYYSAKKDLGCSNWQPEVGWYFGQEKPEYGALEELADFQWEVSKAVSPIRIFVIARLQDIKERDARELRESQLLLALQAQTKPQEAPPKDPVPGFLGLSIDHSGNMITRKGQHATVDDWGKHEWPLVVAMINAGERGLTEHEAKQAFTGDKDGNAMNNAKSQIKSKLEPLALTIRRGQFKIEDDGTT